MILQAAHRINVDCSQPNSDLKGLAVSPQPLGDFRELPFEKGEMGLLVK